MPDELRPLWDFADLDATEQRFRALLAQEPSQAERAEILTQLARINGRRGNFAEGDRLVDEAEAVAHTPRSALERGRLRRSEGNPEAALPLFESAFTAFVANGEDALAADAAHMAALAAPDRDGMVAWTQRGIGLAESSADPQANYWLGPLLNNLGWEYYGAGEYHLALDAFERALQVRELDPNRPAEIEIARYAVGKTLRALGRPEEAAAFLEQAVAWTETSGKPDGWFHEELAEDYAALGRAEEARVHARLALDLLEGDTERLARLRELAAES